MNDHLFNDYTREFVDPKEIKDWANNPRGGVLRGIDEFAAQIQADGGIREDLHVFILNGEMTAMQGHRRKAAALKLGLPGVWVRRYAFTDEGTAFRLLMTLQNGNDPFDPREMAKAARTALEVGIPKEELPGIMHRAEDTVQLYLDLGTLPHSAQEAVYNGKMPLHTASLLRKLPGPEAQREATLQILHDSITGAPMSAEQAKIYLEQRYLIPARQLKEWQVLEPKLKRKHPVASGFHYVSYEDRLEYVMGEEGAPQGGFVQADMHIDDSELMDPAKPMTWGALATAHSAPVYVVPAPKNKAGYVLLVQRQALVQAERLIEDEETRVLKVGPRRVKVPPQPAPRPPEPAREPAPAAESEDNSGQQERAPENPAVAVVPEPEEEADVEDDEVHDDERVLLMRRIIEALAKRPAIAQTDRVWSPLMARAMANLDGLPMNGLYAEMMGMLNADNAARGGLRWCLTALFASELFSEEPDAEALSGALKGMGLEVPEFIEG